MAYGKSATKSHAKADSTHAEALEAYEVAKQAADDNNRAYEQDYEFALSSSGSESVQWTAAEKASRSVVGRERPMMTINVLPSFGRQVINDIRQNRPAIKVRPADSGADIETALVMTGLIRNIEYTSNAEVAHDTAAECAVYGGFGYYRIDIAYACDDTFDQDIRIERIANPLSVLGDPYSKEADSSDWNMAFVENLLTRKEFEEAYPDADPVEFSGRPENVKRDWTHGDDILVCEYWKRSKAMKTVLLLSDGKTVDAELFVKRDPETGLSQQDICFAQDVTVKTSRQIETHVVDQCILNGQEELTDKVRWAGRYIPIIPVYGEEINIKGKRIFRSMIHRAIDAQRQLNFWETTATELAALAPRVPFIGEDGAFTDPNWEIANTANLPYLTYKKGMQRPERQPLDSGPAAGAIQEAMRSNDRIKQILGMYDASLGQRSNETSGKAIDARKLEADVGNFHFSDNLSRAIRHEGRILLDLIPKVYTKGRILRVMGVDGQQQNVQLGDRQQAQQPMQPGQEPNPPKIGALQGVFDLTMGKYDLTVETGPSYTTQRAETAAVVGELIRANPDMMQICGDLLVSNLDLKEGEEIARRMKKMLPPQLQDNGQETIPPQVQQKMQEMEQALGELTEQLQQEKSANLKGAGEVEKAKVQHEQIELDRARLPKEEMLAQAELISKQIQLRQTELTGQAQVAESTASAGEKNASASMLNEVTAAATALQHAAQTLAMAAQANAITSAAPKRKRMTVQKINGAYVGESVEVPEPNGAM
jgi:hypothetical protein